MIHGFDLDSSLVCEGIIGDGCGGGRLFIIEIDTLFAYDSKTKEKIILLENIELPLNIKKKACTIFIECEKQHIEFNLSSMTKSVKKI